MPSMEETRRRHRDAAERVWYLALSVVAVLVILGAVISSASVSPRFCSLCHRAESNALSSTVHRGMSCDRCHVGASAFDLVQARLSVLDMLAWQLVPSRQHVAAALDNKRCLMCHADDITKTVTVGRLKMSHQAVVEADWRCEKCHPATAHSSGSKLALGYTMDMCMGCHSSNAQDIATCETCHVDPKGGSGAKDRSAPTPWRVVHGANWQQTHGMGDLSTCKGCHPANYCAQCHNLNVPHPDGYMNIHGADVLGRANGAQDCMRCHRENSCDNCHGLKMPHPNGFLQSHDKLVKREGERVCQTCHDQKSCESCHVKHTHPGLPDEQRTWLQEHPVQ